MTPRPAPAPIAPGQESVWDYPRPPAVRQCDRAIRVVLGGEEICSTSSSWQVLETSHPPTYYIPRSAFVTGSLRPADGRSVCEWKGTASYLDLVSRSAVASRAAWFYPTPTLSYTMLVDHIALYAAMVDGCFVDDERVIPQAGSFYGGWITSDIVGPFKGFPGTSDW
jgi:uncharacterized protein (DUF427 family)